MKTMMLIAVALVLGACGGCDDTTKVEPFNTRIVSAVHNGINWTVDMKITGASAAQELDMIHFDEPSGGMRNDTMVEFFHVPSGGWHGDRHIIGVGESREMVIYPATISEDAELVDDYAKLASNVDGSFVTNQWGDVLYPGGLSKGRVASADMSRAIRWRMECTEAGLMVVIDGVEHWFSKPHSRTD